MTDKDSYQLTIFDFIEEKEEQEEKVCDTKS